MNLNDVAKLLLDSSVKTVSIYTHINTDFDAMGSMLATRMVLMGMGKKVDVFVNSSFPSAFEFFGDLSFVNKKTCEYYDLAVCLDSANKNRLGKYKFSYLKGVKNSVLIDHHHTAYEEYCKYNFCKKASSTAEILFEIFEEMKISLTPEICKYLIAGIMTDTGKFSHSATSETFKTLSKLVKIGNLQIEEISAGVFNSMKMENFNLVKLAYKKVEFFSNNKLALIMFDDKDFKETGTTIDDTDGISDIPLQIKTVQFAILASCDGMGYFRVSFRSKGNEFSARAVAESFGGGGHFNASGCKIFGEFDEVKQQLLDNTLSVLHWEK